MKKRNQRRTTAGYVLYPFLLYWVINMAAVAVAEAVVIARYAMKYVDPSAGAKVVMEYINSHYDKIYTLVSAHAVELTTAGAIATGIMAWILLRKDRKEAAEQEKNAGGIKTKTALKAGWKYYPLLAVFGAAVCVALNNLSNMAGLAFYSEAYQKTSATFYSAGFAVQIVCLGILIPISEEMVFRGLIFGRCRRISMFRTAMLYSAAFFAVSHGNMVQILYSFVLGLFLAYVYETFSSLAAPICLHITVNMTSLLLTKADGFTWMFSSAVRLGIFTIGGVFISACIFVLIRQNKEKQETPEASEQNINKE